MFKPSPKVVAALRGRIDDASLDAELARKRPDLTSLLLLVARDEDGDLGRELTAAVCRAGCALLGERHPGASIEVRVPPFAAVQLALDDAGRHRRGTPPNVVECAPEVMLRLAAGSLTWLDALATHQVRASGTRSDLAGVFPLIG